jgi:hypothetical protein
MKHIAIRNLYPKVQVILNDGDDGEIFDGQGNDISNQIDKELVRIEVERLTNEINKNKYKFLRKKEYPPQENLADALYWASKGDDTKLNEYYAACEAVKNLYPKSN